MEKHNGTILLLCAASVLLLVTLITKGWFRGEETRFGITAKVGVGIWGSVQFCGDDRKGKERCVTRKAKVSKLKGSAKAQVIFGKAAVIIGAISSLLLLIVSVMLGSHKPATKHTALAALIGVGLTAACGLMFLILKQKWQPGIGWGVYLFFPAVAAGIASSVMAMRALSYLDEQPVDHSVPRL